MREFLEDVHEHMNDGYGRAQAHNKTPMRKRFYKEVSAAPIEGGFSINLDGRPTKTPGHKLVHVLSETLAVKMVGEWEVQEEFIDPRTMPLVRLVNSAVEGGVDVEAALREEVVKFAGNDLMLFRADSPRELVALQTEHWGSALARIEKHFGVKFESVIGIVNKNQPQASLDCLATDLENLGFMELTALVSITGLTGSGLLAFALRHGLIEADQVWDLAHVDETYNAKNWGADAEAIARLEKRKIEFDAAVTVLELTGGA